MFWLLAANKAKPDIEIEWTSKCWLDFTLVRQPDVCLNAYISENTRFGRCCPSAGPRPCSYYRIAVDMVTVVCLY